MTAEMQKSFVVASSLKRAFGCIVPGSFIDSLLICWCFFTLCFLQNMMEQLKDQLAEIVHTKEGSQVAMLCIAHASPKVSSLLIHAYISLDDSSHERKLMPPV